MLDQQLWGLFLNFDWLDHNVKFLNVLTTEWVILCTFIGDVQQFIGHCHIPLDPWVFILS